MLAPVSGESARTYRLKHRCTSFGRTTIYYTAGKSAYCKIGKLYSKKYSKKTSIVRDTEKRQA
jgi:hypothetical protein